MVPVRDGRRQWGGRAHENEGAPNSQQASSVQNRPFVERRRNRAGSAHSSPGSVRGARGGRAATGPEPETDPARAGPAGALGQDPSAPQDRTHQPPGTGLAQGALLGAGRARKAGGAAATCFNSQGQREESR